MHVPTDGFPTLEIWKISGQTPDFGENATSVPQISYLQTAIIFRSLALKTSWSFSFAMVPVMVT